MAASNNAASGDTTDSDPWVPDNKRAKNPTVGHSGREISRDEYLSFQYPCNNTTRGKAVIINNEKFHKSLRLEDRKGTQRDYALLKNRFSDLSFDVIDHHDVTKNEMIDILKNVAGEDHSNADCFVCIILSHGIDGMVYGTDGPLSLQDLMEPFKGNNCSSLACKPKMFFIQACQEEDQTVADAHLDDSRDEVVKIPNEADFLICVSSIPGKYAWKQETKDCSWFVTALSYVLDKHGDTMELQKMMVTVNRKIKEELEKRKASGKYYAVTRLPCVTSMLTKEVYFKEKGK